MTTRYGRSAGTVPGCRGICNSILWQLRLRLALTLAQLTLGVLEAEGSSVDSSGILGGCETEGRGAQTRTLIAMVRMASAST